ncbi:rhamnan synthesis F family protein [Xanthomonas hortorum]|uniref:rhamnan synthesis F family protein n=1 Tax=Xanthomonas hortorum TaxID=56454 RepID=UPI0029365F79|nr:rhamnan synthesis F family protein [Xanthomonas hortorum]MDV2449659.1 rhamnan synthesis F family protein [Xanthomonas hortorum NBC5720]
MRRLCIFSFYDPQGLVDDYVIHFLKELSRFTETIIVYSNGELLEDSARRLRDIVDELIVRPNIGFDVLAYKEGLRKTNNGKGYEEALLVNHTCYGPIFPFEELFAEMEGRHCDFWGVTAHKEISPNPFTGSGTLPYHLNANFIAIRSRMLRSQEFSRYWKAIEGKSTYEEAIAEHEATFTHHFRQAGFKCESYLDSEKYGNVYPALLDIDETLIDRNPLLKRRLFFQEPSHLERHSVDLPRALQIIQKTSNYDPNLIWRNAVRGAELRTITTNAGLTSIFPDIRINEKGSTSEWGNVAICAHVYYPDMVEELLQLGDTIPCKYDFIATTETEEKKALIEQAAAGRENINEVIVRVVERNRGRDMSSLFITCRDLFIGDRYNLVCRLHTKKTPHVHNGRSNVFKRHMFENLLKSSGYTANVLDMFRDHPWIGVAVPSIIQMSYGTLGHAWGTNRARTMEVAKRIGIDVKFDSYTPVGAFGGMFWFRPKALHKLFAHPWQWTDFEAEPYPLDGSLGHALERIITYVAQDAQFTTQQILSSRLAEWNFAVLEYKLQKLSSALPNADFAAQAEFLYEWKNAKYRSSAMPVAARPAPTLSQSLRGLVAACKRSLKYRFHALARR